MTRLVIPSSMVGGSTVPGASVCGISNSQHAFGMVSVRPARWDSNGVLTMLFDESVIGNCYQVSADGFAVGAANRGALLASTTTATILPPSSGFTELHALSRVVDGVFYVAGTGPNEVRVAKINASDLSIKESKVIDVSSLSPMTIDEAGWLAGYDRSEKRMTLLVPSGTRYETRSLPALSWATRLVRYDGKVYLVGNRHLGGDIHRAGIVRVDVDGGGWEQFPLMDFRVGASNRYRPAFEEKLATDERTRENAFMGSYDACVVTTPYARSITAACGSFAYQAGVEWLAAAVWSAGTTANLNDALLTGFGMTTGAGLDVATLRFVRASGLNEFGDVAGIAVIEFRNPGPNVAPVREHPFLLLRDRVAAQATGSSTGTGTSSVPGVGTSTATGTGGSGSAMASAADIETMLVPSSEPGVFEVRPRRSRLLDPRLDRIRVENALANAARPKSGPKQGA